MEMGCMESYNEFLERVFSFETETMSFGGGDFRTNPSVYKKVADNRQFINFYGDTVVFDLEDDIKQLLKGYLDLLYRDSEDCFGERLVSNTFHMTLHDLSNSNNLAEIPETMEANQGKLVELLNRNQHLLHTTTEMESPVIFNMVNASLVLGLIPKNENEYAKLIKLYYLINGVLELPYPLTPHITLAYFSRNGFSEPKARELEAIINELNKTKLPVRLDTKNLIYQRYTSMNDYQTELYLEK